MDNCIVLSGYDEIYNTTLSYYETAINTFHVAAAHHSGGSQRAGADA